MADNINMASPLESEGVRGDGQIHWYIAHTYSGHENKVKMNIEKMVESRGLQDKIIEVVVPMENVVEVKNGERKVKTRKMFPGYVFVKMIVNNETWYLVRNTQGVTGFLGHGSEPTPLTDTEIARMNLEKVVIDIKVAVGETIKVIDGPFSGLVGQIEEVNDDKQTVRVKLDMFGRETPTELDFAQIDKLNK